MSRKRCSTFFICKLKINRVYYDTFILELLYTNHVRSDLCSTHFATYTMTKDIVILVLLHYCNNYFLEKLVENVYEVLYIKHHTKSILGIFKASMTPMGHYGLQIWSMYRVD